MQNINFKLFSSCIILILLLFCQNLKPAYSYGTGFIANNVIQIIYDKAGIPHVIASSTLGAFYGFGYCTAKSRLFQLEILKRSVRGELSEIFGNDYIELDKIIKQEKISFDDYSNQLLTAPSSFTRALQSFTAGINAAIKNIKERKLPLDEAFISYGLEPSYFSEKDLLDIFIGTMAVRYNDFTQEIDNLALLRYLVAKFGYKAAYKIFDDVIPFQPASTTCMIQKDYNNLSSYEFIFTNYKLFPDFFSFISNISNKNLISIKSILDKRNNLLKKLGIATKSGSYAFIASSRINKNKVSVVYGGPQMGYFKPPALFCIGLHCPEFDIVGTTIPGYIFLIFATNRNLAFTATAGIGNLVDIVTAKKIPGSLDLYSTLDGKIIKLLSKSEKIFIKNQNSPVTITIEHTDIGPVVNRNKDYIFIKHRAWKDKILFSYYAWFESNFACDIEEYLNISDKMTLAINWLVADKNGNIACVHTGLGKTRHVMGDDRLPSSKIGNFVYPDLRIADINSSSGWYANWNCSPIKNYKIGDLQSIWLEDQRTAFLVDQISKHNAAFDMEFFKMLEREIAFTDLRAYFYKNKLLEYINIEELNPYQLQVFQKLIAWDNKRIDLDKDGFLDDCSAGIFENFWNKIFESVFEPILGSFTWMITSDSTWTQSAILLKALEKKTNFDYFLGQDASKVITKLFKETIDQIIDKNGKITAKFHMPKMEFLSAVPVNNTVVNLKLGPAYLPCFMNRGSDVQITFLTPESINVFGVLPPGNDCSGNYSTNQLQAFEQIEFFERPLIVNQLLKNSIKREYIKIE